MNEQESIITAPAVLQVPEPKTVVILHDIFGGPTMDWLPAVKKTLESHGHTVITPGLPTGLLASYTLWKTALHNTLKTVPPESILVGHGIGGNILLSFLSENTYNPTMLILVNTPLGIPEHAGYRKLAASFFAENYVWENIGKQTPGIYTLVSNNDPFVERDSAKGFSSVLGAKVIDLGDRGHITAADGQNDLPELSDIINTYDQKILDTLAGIAEAEKDVRDTQLIAANIPGLHTMQTDMAHISTKNISTVGSGLLRRTRDEEKEAYKNSLKNPVNIVYTLIGIILFLGGLGLLGFGITKFIPETATVFFKQADPSSNAPIIIDSSEKPFNIDALQAAEIYTTLNTLGVERASGTHTIIGIPITSKGGNARLSDYFSPIGSKLYPEISILGNENVFYGMSLRPDPAAFMIIKVPSYDGGYTAMKSWSRSMVRDIGIWMLIDPEFVKNSFTPVKFKEEIIANNTVNTLYMSEEVLLKPDTKIFTPIVDSAEDSINTHEAVPVSEGIEAATMADIDTSVTPEQVISESISNTTSSTKVFFRPGESILHWMFLDENTILITRSSGSIPEIIKRFHEKKGRLQVM